MKSDHISRLREDPVIARSFPFLLFIGLLIMGSIFWPSSAEKDPNAFGHWFVVARGVIVGLLLVWFWPAYIELHRSAFDRSSRWIEAILAGIAVFLVWIYFDKDWAVLSQSGGFNPLRQDQSTDWLLVILRLFGLALVVPVMEELFWRSFVMRWIVQHDFLSVEPSKVGIRAFSITAVLFALEHDQWLAGLIAGMAYNWLYMRSGSLWTPIISHAVTNAMLGVWILYTKAWHFW